MANHSLAAFDLQMEFSAHEAASLITGLVKERSASYSDYQRVAAPMEKAILEAHQRAMDIAHEIATAEMRGTVDLVPGGIGYMDNEYGKISLSKETKANIRNGFSESTPPALPSKEILQAISSGLWSKPERTSLKRGYVFYRSDIENWLKLRGYKDAHYFVPNTGNASVSDDKPLDTRERTTLLNIIGALAKQAGFDLTKPHEDANAIEAILSQAGITIASRTIAEHLKKVDSRLKGNKK